MISGLKDGFGNTLKTTATKLPIGFEPRSVDFKTPQLNMTHVTQKVFFSP